MQATPSPQAAGKTSNRRQPAKSLFQHVVHSKIPSDSIAILCIFLAISLPQESFFAQYLTVEQPNARDEVSQ
jgi:hypothetical protein